MLKKARGALSKIRTRLRPQPKQENGSPAASRSQAVVEAVAALLGKGLNDLVDLTASRLLSLDDAASELALFVERTVDDLGHAEVLRAVTRHNLLLDGTILALIQPLLTDDQAAQTNFDHSAVDRARDTITNLVCELTGYDSEDNPSRLDFLEDIGFAADYPAVFQYLEGGGALDDDGRFVFGSYLIFLQTFAMRLASRSLAVGFTEPRPKQDALSAD